LNFPIIGVQANKIVWSLHKNKLLPNNYHALLHHLSYHFKTLKNSEITVAVSSYQPQRNFRRWA